MFRGKVEVTKVRFVFAKMVEVSVYGMASDIEACKGLLAAGDTIARKIEGGAQFFTCVGDLFEDRRVELRRDKYKLEMVAGDGERMIIRECVLRFALDTDRIGDLHLLQQLLNWTAVGELILKPL